MVDLERTDKPHNNLTHVVQPVLGNVSQQTARIIAGIITEMPQTLLWNICISRPLIRRSRQFRIHILQ